MTKVGLCAISTSTTLASNKSHCYKLSDMANSIPSFFVTLPHAFRTHSPFPHLAKTLILPWCVILE
jgi:hypothetical protein